MPTTFVTNPRRNPKAAPLAVSGATRPTSASEISAYLRAHGMPGVTLRKGRDGAFFFAGEPTAAWEGDNYFEDVALDDYMLDEWLVLARLTAAGERVYGSDTAPTSDAFKKWFGKSKVVDSAGEPLVVYHGTMSAFDTFDPQHTGKNTWQKVGFSFSSDLRTAATYGNTILPVYLSLQNPLVIDAKGNYWKHLGEYGTADTAGAAAKEKGYDGIIVRNVGDANAGYWPETATTYVAFYPTQIKAARGNVGTFSSDDPNIYKNPRRKNAPSARASLSASRSTTPIVGPVRSEGATMPTKFVTNPRRRKKPMSRSAKKALHGRYRREEGLKKGQNLMAMAAAAYRAGKYPTMQSALRGVAHKSNPLSEDGVVVSNPRRSSGLSPTTRIHIEEVVLYGRDDFEHEADYETTWGKFVSMVSDLSPRRIYLGHKEGRTTYYGDEGERALADMETALKAHRDATLHLTETDNEGGSALYNISLASKSKKYPPRANPPTGFRIAGPAARRKNPATRTRAERDPQRLWPSVARMAQVFNIAKADAAEMRSLMEQGRFTRVLNLANKLFDGNGVENLFSSDGLGGLMYVNMGDPYATTLIFDVDDYRYSIGSWGDIVEADARLPKSRQRFQD